MLAVLDKLAALEAKPFSTLTVPEARTPASLIIEASACLFYARESA